MLAGLGGVRSGQAEERRPQQSAGLDAQVHHPLRSRNAFEPDQGTAQHSGRFGQRRTREAAARGFQPVRRCFLGQPALGQMQRKNFGTPRHAGGIDCLHGPGNALVKIAAAAPQQTVIGGVAHQCMAERERFTAEPGVSFQDA